MIEKAVASSAPPLLRVKDLIVDFKTEQGVLRAVDRVSFDISEGQTVCVVGESGCGKSVTGYSIMRLLPVTASALEPQMVDFMGQDLATISDPAMQTLRGRRLAMIFQDPMTALNPVYTVGHQIAEVIVVHEGKTAKKEVRDRVVALLTDVGIPDPARRLENYPHELSGGMRQRIVIAMALACRPRLLIADEPTTALDVTIQAQILDLFKSLQARYQMGFLFITHDFGVVAEIASDVNVMYSGRIVERGPKAVVLGDPLHPYTKGLLASLPSMGPSMGPAMGRAPVSSGGRQALPSIPGQVPSPFSRPVGCRFQDRCYAVQSRCREREPELEIKKNRLVACFEVNS